MPRGVFANHNTQPATQAWIAKALAKHSEIIELTEKGVPRSEIARRLDVSTRTISRVCSDAGMNFRTRCATEDDKLRAKEMLEDGACYAEVSRTIGFGQKEIKRWFPGYTWNQDQRNEMAAMQRRMDGLTWRRGTVCDKRKRPWEYRNLNDSDLHKK